MSSLSKIFIGIIIISTLALPAMSFAVKSNASLLPRGYWGPLISCNQTRDMSGPGGTWNGGYTDSCSSLCDLVDTSQNFIYFGMTLALFVFAPVLLLWGGLVIMTAHGAPAEFTKGRQILTKTLTGAAIVLGSFLILNTFLWAIGSKISPQGKGGVAWPNIECRPENIPGGQIQAQ